MTQIELRRLMRGSGTDKIVETVNDVLDVVAGNASAQIALYGFDGNRRQTVTQNGVSAGAVSSSGQYAFDLHSSHASGLLLAARKIATTRTAAATVSNCVLLLAEAGAYLGSSTVLRLYAADATDYAQVSSDADGGLVLGGSGANAGTYTVTKLIAATIGPNATQQHALPAVTSDTLALLAASQTFTNKTLTSPTINAGTLSGTFGGNFTASGILTLSNAAPINFSAVAARISGQFDHATRASRPFFQSNATNGDTNVSAMPSGSNTISKFEAHNNSTPGSATVVASLEANNTEARVTAATAAGAAAALQLYSGTTKALGVSTAAAVEIPVTAYIGDTSNANVTQGLTINQGANDDVILAFKSSDVSHGMTSLVEDDTFGDALKDTATTGGLRIRGWSESTIGLNLVGIITTGDTTRSTAAVGPVMTQSAIKSGTTAVAQTTANENIFVVRNGGLAKMLVDIEGDVLYDGATGAGAWDEHDDVALLEAFRVTMAPGVTRNYRERFSADIAAHAQILADTGVVTLNEDGHHFVSTKGLNGLLIDAIRQERGHRVRLEQQVATLQEHVMALAGSA